MTMASIGIEVERKASLAIVTIARQDRLNAFNQAMFEALEDAARGLSKGTLPRAVIITGAGPNAFCAGFDVNPDNPMVAEMARAVDRGEKTPILTARRIGADEALALGLVNRVSAPGNALNDAIAMAEAISRNGPRAVRSALKVIRAGRHLSLKETLDLEQRTAVDLIASGECLHGIGAFLAGETATFPDLLPEDTVE